MTITFAFFLNLDGVPVADIDLVAASAQQGATTGPSNVLLAGGRPCAAIRADAAGDLMVVSERGGAPVKLRFLAGETQHVSATAIVAAGSSAGDLTVFWAH